MTSSDEALEYLRNLERTGSVFRLENIRRILRLLGNPQDTLKTVHIAGTNGKGSIASMIAQMLMAAGYRVGKYTSPHLLSFTERIAIDNEEILVSTLAGLVSAITKIAGNGKGQHPFSYFDFTTTLAFSYFAENKVDLAVVETGLGGRLDSTNVIRPLASVITNVARDHVEFLGNSLESIAREKAGIIKKGVPVVTGATGGPLRVITKTARDFGSPLHILNKHFTFQKTGERAMSYAGAAGSIHEIIVGLRGDHQLANAAIAIRAVELLSPHGFSVSPADIRFALSHVYWPGRLEELEVQPRVILDGAHNVHGTVALARYLGEYHAHRRKILIFGAMKDKEYRKMLATLRPHVDAIILTKPNMERALDPEEMKSFTNDSIISENIRDALDRARSFAGKDDIVVITGSLFTVGEAKKYIHEIF